MNHVHITLGDVRGFAALAMGQEPRQDAQQIADFGASVRFCPECSRRARQGCAAIFPMEWVHLDPTRDTDQCLPIDDMIDLSTLDQEHRDHFGRCVRCQLRFHEALALSELGHAAEESHDTAEVVLSLVKTTLRIAASWAAILLVPGLASGLLGATEDEVSEAVISQGELKGSRIRVMRRSRRVLVSDVPSSVAPGTLRLRLDDRIVEAVGVSGNEATFDLSEFWHEADHPMEVLVVREG
jgi:hypothetical protein